MSRLETETELIAELAASVAPAAVAVVAPDIVEVDLASRVPWEESAEYTQFVMTWLGRPKFDVITQILVDEMSRRRGLLAYGVRVQPRRRSKVNAALASVMPFVPRLLSSRSERGAPPQGGGVEQSPAPSSGDVRELAAAVVAKADAA